MKRKERKDKIKYKNKIRKQQQVQKSAEKKVSEDDCGASDESLKRLESKMLEMSGGKEHKVIRDSSLERMSDILLEYGDPLFDGINTDNKKEYEKAIMMSIRLWNCAIMQEEPEGKKEIEKMLKPMMPDAESKSVVRYMLGRKHEMFPKNKRMIMNYELTETADGFHLTVASTIPSE
jgi:ABC-type iron transport system FetAB ATPase subunit